jgi:hypothetical protein
MANLAWRIDVAEVAIIWYEMVCAVMLARHSLQFSYGMGPVRAIPPRNVASQVG